MTQRFLKYYERNNKSPLGQIRHYLLQNHLSTWFSLLHPCFVCRFRGALFVCTGSQIWTIIGVVLPLKVRQPDFLVNSCLKNGAWITLRRWSLWLPFCWPQCFRYCSWKSVGHRKTGFWQSTTFTGGLLKAFYDFLLFREVQNVVFYFVFLVGLCSKLSARHGGLYFRSNGKFLQTSGQGKKSTAWPW